MEFRVVAGQSPAFIFVERGEAAVVEAQQDVRAARGFTHAAINVVLREPGELGRNRSLAHLLEFGARGFDAGVFDLLRLFEHEPENAFGRAVFAELLLDFALQRDVLIRRPRDAFAVKFINLVRVNQDVGVVRADGQVAAQIGVFAAVPDFAPVFVALALPDEFAGKLSEARGEFSDLVSQPPDLLEQAFALPSALLVGFADERQSRLQIGVFQNRSLREFERGRERVVDQRPHFAVGGVVLVGADTRSGFGFALGDSSGVFLVLIFRRVVILLEGFQSALEYVQVFHSVLDADDGVADPLSDAAAQDANDFAQQPLRFLFDLYDGAAARSLVERHAHIVARVVEMIVEINRQLIALMAGQVLLQFALFFVVGFGRRLDQCQTRIVGDLRFDQPFGIKPPILNVAVNLLRQSVVGLRVPEAEIIHRFARQPVSQTVFDAQRREFNRRQPEGEKRLRLPQTPVQIAEAVLGDVAANAALRRRHARREFEEDVLRDQLEERGFWELRLLLVEVRGQIAEIEWQIVLAFDPAVESRVLHVEGARKRIVEEPRLGRVIGKLLQSAVAVGEVDALDRTAAADDQKAERLSLRMDPAGDVARQISGVNECAAARPAEQRTDDVNIQAVIHRAPAFGDEAPPVVVVDALGAVVNRLLDLLRIFSEGDAPESAHRPGAEREVVLDLERWREPFADHRAKSQIRRAAVGYRRHFERHAFGLS
ncbi:MAG: hypothetical protein JMDDDDMK_03309 [Acidobacteria bacterium]|nr:hypothetical protein [Acidobacteriota bacterium]